MNDPDRRNGRNGDAATDEDPHSTGERQAGVSKQLAAVGGELLEGSGFEHEEADEEFL